MPHLPSTWPSATSPTAATKNGHLSKVHPEFAPILEETRKQTDEMWSLPLPEFRKAWLAFPRAVFPDSPVEGQDFTIEDSKVPVRDGAEVGIRIYRPTKKVENASLVLTIHAGGWAVGSHELEGANSRHLAAETGSVVVSVDYRMAPEHPYPTPINDSFDVLLWCQQNASTLSINATSIFLCGHSAGGNMSAALAQKCRDEGVTGVVGQMLTVPVTCHPAFFPAEKYEYASLEQNKDAPDVKPQMLWWFWNGYLEREELGKEPYASPLLAETLEGLPPALVQVAGLDPVRDDGLAYAEALKEAGVPTTLKVYPGLPHIFKHLAHMKEAREETRSMVEFVKDIRTGLGL